MTAGVVVKNMFVFPCHRDLLSGRCLDANRHRHRFDLYDLFMSSEAELTDTVAHMQLEVEALKFAQSGPSTLPKRGLRGSAGSSG